MKTYYQKIGTDPASGMPIYVSSRNKIHKSLAQCKCCGATDTIANDTLVDMCDECGLLWKAYNMAKTRVVSERACKSLYEKILYLYDKKQKGYVVPKDLMLRKAEIEEKLLMYYKPAVSPITHTDVEQHCKLCGAYIWLDDEILQQTCTTCSDALKQYKRFCRRCGALTLNECFEFYDVLHMYLVEYKKGHWAPNVDLMMVKLKKRVRELEVLDEV